MAFETEEEFFLGPFHYEIVSQRSDREEYAVRVTLSNGKTNEYREWLKHPESRYETLGGARYAILMDAEDRISKHIKIQNSNEWLSEALNSGDGVYRP